MIQTLFTDKDYLLSCLGFCEFTQLEDGHIRPFETSSGLFDLPLKVGR